MLEEKTLLTLLRLDLPQGWIQAPLDMMDYCNGHLNGLFVMFKWQYILCEGGFTTWAEEPNDVFEV